MQTQTKSSHFMSMDWFLPFEWVVDAGCGDSTKATVANFTGSCRQLLLTDDAIRMLLRKMKMARVERSRKATMRNCSSVKRECNFNIHFHGIAHSATAFQNIQAITNYAPNTNIFKQIVHSTRIKRTNN